MNKIVDVMLYLLYAVTIAVNLNGFLSGLQAGNLTVASISFGVMIFIFLLALDTITWTNK